MPEVKYQDTNILNLVLNKAVGNKWLNVTIEVVGDIKHHHVIMLLQTNSNL